jgi:hypothetical protein
MLFEMLFCGKWKPRIEESASHHKVSAHTVLRLLTRYFLYFDLDAACRWRPRLLTKRRQITAKLGRKSKPVKTGHQPAAAERNADQDDWDAIELYIGSLEDKTISKAAMWRGFERTFRPRNAQMQEDGTLLFTANPNRPFITASQFNYGVAKVVGRLKLEREQAGERRVLTLHRPALGSARDRIPYPGHTYVIDATVADVYLVSAFDRRLLIGRPVIYVVIDAFSSLIVGVHVTLDGPNFAQARTAMYRAVSDKEDWLGWLNLPGLRPFLPQGCRPTRWLADRGELHSKESYQLNRKLDTALSLAAPYRAEWKAVVERVFGILNTLVIHWLPGAVRQRVRERGSRDFRLDAVLTLKEFTRIIARVAAQLNLTRDMSRHLSASQMAAGVLANPISFWEWGIRNLHGSAEFLGKTQALTTMLPIIQAKLSRFGVFAQKKRYVGDWVAEHELTQLAGFTGATSLDLIQSPDIPDAAFCLLPSESVLRQVQLHSEFSYVDQYCWEDLEEKEALQDLSAHDLQSATNDVRLAMQQATEDDITRAKKETAQACDELPAISAHSKISNIRENRATEARQAAAPTVPDAAPQLSPKATVDTESFEDGQGEKEEEVGNAYLRRLMAGMEGWGSR